MAYESRLQTLFDFSNLTKVRPLFMLSHRCLTLNRGLTLVRLRFLLTNIIIYDLSFLETPGQSRCVAQINQTYPSKQIWPSDPHTESLCYGYVLLQTISGGAVVRVMTGLTNFETGGQAFCSISTISISGLVDSKFFLSFTICGNVVSSMYEPNSKKFEMIF